MANAIGTGRNGDAVIAQRRTCLALERRELAERKKHNGFDVWYLTDLGYQVALDLFPEPTPKPHTPFHVYCCTDGAAIAAEIQNTMWTSPLDRSDLAPERDRFRAMGSADEHLIKSFATRDEAVAYAELRKSQTVRYRDHIVYWAEYCDF
jgi:hypothetical protein